MGPHIISEHFRIAGRIAEMAIALGVLCSAAFGQEQLAPTASSQTRILPVYTLPAGTTLSATVSYRNESSSDLNPLMDDVKPSGDDGVPTTQPGLSRAIEVSISGEMELSAIGRNGGEHLVRLRMPKAKVALGLDGSSAGFEAGNIARCLSGGAVFSNTAQGKVTRVWIRPECGPTSSGSVRTLIALIQFVVHETGTQDKEGWVTQEDDSTGAYSVKYSRQAETGGTVSFRKEKTRFLSPKATKKRTRHVVLPVIYQPQGGMDFAFDAATGNLRSIRARESYAIIINGRNVGTSNTAFGLEHIRWSIMPPKKQIALLKEHAAIARAVRATPLWVAQSSAEEDTLLYRQRLGNETVTSLLDELSAAEKKGNKDYNDTELYQKLKALIYLHPESCRRLAGAAASGKPDGLASRLLIRAMATIGSPQAQDAIVSVMRARAGDTDFVMAIIPVLGMFEEPAVSTETVLKGLAYHNDNDDITFTAQLALGAMAGNLAEDDPVRAQRIVEEFMSKYPAPSESHDISRVILVLGNARMDEYLPTLQMYAEHPMPEARSDAVYALRYYTGEKAENILIHALASDQDATTRREAAASLGFMEPGDRVVAALEQAYANEKIDEIRIEIVKSLWKFERQYPAIRQLLERVGEKDESEDVRKTVRSILNGHSEK